MGDKKLERFSEVLRKEISDIVAKELANPNIGFITITKVEPTKDFKQAKVFFTTYPEGREEEVKRALESAKGFIGKLLGKRIRAKSVPRLSFEIDRDLKALEKYWEWQERDEES